MKVLAVYHKNDLDTIKINGIAVSKIMDDFFKMYPNAYRINYDKNIQDLELWRIDEHYAGCLAEYFDCHNLIMYRTKKSIIHELIHMAARDPETKRNAFARSNDDSLFENALIEGCTEFLAAKALNENATDYHFEVFSANMLSNIDGFFEPYFIPSYDKLISLFPNKKDILSLMYALSFYADNFDCIDEYKGKTKDLLVTRLLHSVTDVMDSLINIQLSMNCDENDNNEYADKFLSLIEGKNLVCCLKDIRKDYLDYANDQVKTRILRR